MRPLIRNIFQTWACLTLCIVLAAPSNAQPVVMATDHVGTILNAGGAGMASVVSKHSKTQVIVSTFGGQDAYVAAIEKGEVDIAPLSSFGAWLQLNGTNPTKTKYKKMRLLRASDGGLRQTFVTAAKSNLGSVAELKGKRVAVKFLATPLLQLSTTASLEAAGLSLSDVVGVNVSGIPDGVRALEGGRVDASWTAFGVPIVQEVNARMQVAYLPIPNSPEAMKVLRKVLFPGVRVTTVTPNPRLFLTKPTPMIDYDIYLVAREGLAADKVKTILTALWDHNSELVKIHPILRTFTDEGAVTDLAVLPYHPAAVEFYKGKGKWSGEMDDVQARNLRAVE